MDPASAWDGGGTVIGRGAGPAPRGQASSLAENPALKAAVDTYAAEAHTGNNASRAQLLETITRELNGR